MPILLKSTANSASTRITTVMDVTTDAVVPCPRLSVLGFTRRPKWQATSAINSPNTTDLDVASHKLATCTAPGSELMNYDGVMPMAAVAASMPPSNAASVVHTLISGITMASASARGMTSR